MHHFGKTAMWSFVLFLFAVHLASAASQSLTDPNGTLLIEGTREGDQIKLSFSYDKLIKDFTGFNLEIQAPDALDAASGKFRSDNMAIQFSSADNYDTVDQLYKLIILSPSLTSNPQGKSGKLGEITFKLQEGKNPDDLIFQFPVIRVYGGGEQLILKENETFSLVGPDTTKPVVEAQPAGGTYSAPQTVTLKITDNDPLAAIHYTLDGSEPQDSSPTYAEPITIASDTVLRFIGIDRAGNRSEVVTERYIIQVTRPEVTAVTIKDERTVTVAFNKAVAGETASLEGEHFRVSPQNDPSAVVQVTAITLNQDQTAADITLASALRKDQIYQLTVQGVKDQSNQTMAAPYTTFIQLPSAGELALLIEKQAEIVEPGETFTLVLKAEAEGFNGFDLYVGYNTELVELVGEPKLHRDFSGEGNGSSLSFTNQNGKLRLTGTQGGAQQLSGKKGLVELTFKAKLAIDGLARFTIDEGSEVRLSNGGAIELSEEVRSSVAISNPDINGDGLTVSDLVRVARANGKTSADSGYDARLDMNKDGVIDAVDVAYVANKLLK
ncbi:chitobiase/beta-hexosaminidase C-terminal domain-containing protein [Paenibacillus sp. GCM10012307]|uniref:Chitobiase/beta-hexosaminidase C-terminal domain-containing protein n=1 Tax=Paenibacillus roseus TaxID=2798579 RepID=A0A934MP81_9BACL|nr:chitobiase/beta-hexosaminidase C-terminal domain-containing protein [Paenibacillus roseus]MBJ6360623.1 chitobiase/beta-hexosaminidase C-terminal domain-containing protein [Paenibacillus roseus]